MPVNQETLVDIVETVIKEGTPSEIAKLYYVVNGLSIVMSGYRRSLKCESLELPDEKLEALERMGKDLVGVRIQSQRDPDYFKDHM